MHHPLFHWRSDSCARKLSTFGSGKKKGGRGPKSHKSRMVHGAPQTSTSTSICTRLRWCCSQQQARGFALMDPGRSGESDTRCYTGLESVCLAVDIKQTHAVTGGGEGGGRGGISAASIEADADAGQGWIVSVKNGRRTRGAAGRRVARCWQSAVPWPRPRPAGCGTNARRWRSGR